DAVAALEFEFAQQVGGELRTEAVDVGVGKHLAEAAEGRTVAETGDRTVEHGHDRSVLVGIDFGGDAGRVLSQPGPIGIHRHSPTVRYCHDWSIGPGGWQECASIGFASCSWRPARYWRRARARPRNSGCAKRSRACRPRSRHATFRRCAGCWPTISSARAGWIAAGRPG